MCDVNIKGLNAIVTGASSGTFFSSTLNNDEGIGKAICEFLGKEGVNVFAVGRSEDKLDDVLSLIKDKGIKTGSKIVDMSKLDTVEEIVPACVQALGGVNILINAAGVLGSSDASEEDWIKCINVDLTSLMILTKRALKEIEKHDRGAIINISSVAGRQGLKGSAAYVAAKHGVVGFTSSLYDDVRENNIKVCSIEPGAVNTPMVADFDMDKKKMIQPEDIAKTVLFVLKFPETGCPTEIVIRPQKSPYKQ